MIASPLTIFQIYHDSNLCIFTVISLILSLFRIRSNFIVTLWLTFSFISWLLKTKFKVLGKFKAGPHSVHWIFLIAMVWISSSVKLQIKKLLDGIKNNHFHCKTNIRVLTELWRIKNDINYADVITKFRECCQELLRGCYSDKILTSWTKKRYFIVRCWSNY